MVEALAHFGQIVEVEFLVIQNPIVAFVVGDLHQLRQHFAAPVELVTLQLVGQVAAESFAAVFVTSFVASELLSLIFVEKPVFVEDPWFATFVFAVLSMPALGAFVESEDLEHVNKVVFLLQAFG